MHKNEPYGFRKWTSGDACASQGRLFTCGRPGRATFERERTPVDIDTIDRWVEGLPTATVVHIVSLLGRKQDGFSEFSYYPFRCSQEPGPEPTFQEWLDARYEARFIVHEFPTTDCRGIGREIMGAVCKCVRTLLQQGSTVVIVDSAGAERTARVGEELGYR